MRTIQTTVYKFTELSETAKQNAINKYRENDSSSFDYIYNDAHNTVNAFHDHFGTKEGIKSWLDVRTSHLDDSLMELKGNRLRTYILNNFYSALYKPSFLGLIDKEVKKHRMVKSFKNYKNELHSFVYSNIILTNSCVLTGVCYDNSLLEPIYKFIRNPESHVNFEMLLNDCFESLERDIEAEIQDRTSDMSIKEYLIDNNIEFTEGGELI